MTFVPPCRRPENDPDDWFISKDGKQYGWDEISDEEKAENLRRRRHAKDKCWTECITRVRTVCLDIALTNNEEHGTWGGYTEDELRKIRHQRDAHR